MADSIVDGIFTANVATAGNAWDVSLKQNLTLMPEITLCSPLTIGRAIRHV